MIDSNMTYGELLVLLKMLDEEELRQDVLVHDDDLNLSYKAVSFCALDKNPKEHTDYDKIIGCNCFIIKVDKPDPAHVAKLKEMKYAYYISPKDMRENDR